MCGRLNVSDFEGIQGFMDDLDLSIYNNTLAPSYNVAPGADVVAAFAVEANQTNNNQKNIASLYADTDIELATVQWGLVPHWVKSGASFRPLINARAETIWHKPSFKNLVSCKRAILFVNGFYEWKRENKMKVAHYIESRENKVLALAAIYDIKSDGLMQVCIITTAANLAMAAIHDRMPVILNKANYKQWLMNSSPVPKIYKPEKYKPDTLKLDKLMQACNDDDIVIRQVSNYVNNARNNGRQCLQ